MKLLVLAGEGGDTHRHVLTALVDAARQAGDVRVLAPDAEGRLLRALDVPVESWKPAGLFNVLGSIGALRRAVEHQAPDAIHAIGWTAAAVALGALPPARAARTVVTVTDPIAGAGIPKPFADKRLPELLARAGFVTASYTALADTLVERFGVHPDRVAVVPPGVAPSPAPTPPREPHQRGPTIGFPGRLDAQRAWRAAVDALAILRTEHPTARLRFASADPARPLVRAYARDRGVLQAVTFDDDDLAFEPAAAPDLVVIPRGSDGLPVPLLQALVDGIPVVGTNWEGIGSTLSAYETGWLVPDGGAGLAAGIADAWPHIDAAWAGAQAQRPRAEAAYDPGGAAARLAALHREAAR